MARNQVTKLWTTIVTAFLALCTALGLITTTAAAAVPQPEPAGNSTNTTPVTTPTLPQWSWTFAAALPPTMKQRISAEAHGKSPSCRLRPSADTDECAPTSVDLDVRTDTFASVPKQATPLQL
ncbi:DUF6344 domain-containing protein [Streptomyces spinosirectus]|jgi:hypothetical protein|uniref:DUF6344 domain-containing protein n=1 Tax=Streptomyces TaxID=1883 RepID=UPI000D354E55|nr:MULTISPECIES: DUF6344 domain-containing protein [Streptomyces]MBY8343720.1 hypothetical protein [Streptomyces plumbidurans]PTM95626.1 hypothetical protein C7821_105147 [Streptomyces sp. VMFN-G11Ma]UIR19286.1 DUF6344 domain-containing protein [Streptomyces spinosirectus]